MAMPGARRPARAGTSVETQAHFDTSRFPFSPPGQLGPQESRLYGPVCMVVEERPAGRAVPAPGLRRRPGGGLDRQGPAVHPARRGRRGGLIAGWRLEVAVFRCPGEVAL